MDLIQQQIAQCVIRHRSGVLFYVCTLCMFPVYGRLKAKYHLFLYWDSSTEFSWLRHYVLIKAFVSYKKSVYTMIFKWPLYLWDVCLGGHLWSNSLSQSFRNKILSYDDIQSPALVCLPY